MFAKLRGRRQSFAAEQPPLEQRPRRGSNATTRTTASRSNLFAYFSSASFVSAPLERPSTAGNDFASSRPSFANAIRPSSRQSSSGVRPKTSDGSGATSFAQPESAIASLPPILPPIPRVASRYSKFLSITPDSPLFRKHSDAAETHLSKESDLCSVASSDSRAPSTALTSRATESVLTRLPQDSHKGGSEDGTNMDPSFFSKAPAEGRMEATMFPTSDAPLRTPSIVDPYEGFGSGRAFVDSRDKGYYPSMAKATRAPSQLSISTNEFPAREYFASTDVNTVPPNPVQPEHADGRQQSAVARPLLSPKSSDSRISTVSAVSPSSVLARTEPSISSEQGAKVSPLPSPLSEHNYASLPRSSSQQGFSSGTRPGLFPMAGTKASSATPQVIRDERSASGTRQESRNTETGADVPRQHARHLDDMRGSAATIPKSSINAPAAITTPTIFPPPVDPNAAEERARQFTPKHIRLQTSPSDPSLTSKSSVTDSAGSSSRKGSKAVDRQATADVQSPITIGTPYQETSTSHPLPQHVATRPKTATEMAQVAGVDVPTYTSKSAKSSASEQSKTNEKRKTRFLNPIAFLNRKRSTGEMVPNIKPREDERAAQAQAFAKQKSVAIDGVRQLPPDFDPRIKGKVVHDFSSPRRDRQGLSQDLGAGGGNGRWSAASRNSQIYAPDRTSGTETASRRSVHSPVFREHLAESPDDTRRASSLNAEQLENKNFVQRVSASTATSSDGAHLPPFARRNQQLDLAQQQWVNNEHQPGPRSRFNSDNFAVPSFSRDGSRAEIRNDEHPQIHAEGEHSRGGSRAATYGPLPARTTSAQSTGLGINPLSSGMVGSLTTGAENSGLGYLQPSQNGAITMATPPEQFSSHASPFQATLKGPHIGILGLDGIRNDRNSSLPTPDRTPEQSAGRGAPSAPSFGEKAAHTEQHHAASGAPKKSSLPRHRVSNASRFSFQLGGSAEEEEALEERHRRSTAGLPAASTGMQDSDYDDDDYFDEDAMDDMDEMERQHELAGNGPTHHLPDFRHQLASDSSDSESSSSAEEHDVMHGLGSRHARLHSDSSILTVNTNLVMRTPMTLNFPTIGPRPSGLDNPGNGNPLKNTSIAAETITPGASSNATPPRFALQKPPAPRAVGNKPLVGTSPLASPRLADSFNRQDSPAAPKTGARSSGLNFGNFGDFRFADEPDSDIPGGGMPAAVSASATFRPFEQAKIFPQPRTHSPSVPKKGESAPYHGRIGQGIRARKTTSPRHSAGPRDAKSDEDLYFDDGGFEHDKHPLSVSHFLDEDQFDDPEFLESLNNHHRRQLSDTSITGTGSSNGPYPIFAMGSKFSATSQHYHKDPAYQNQINPKLIPQRNPSEDAKRLGLSRRAPPLPANPANQQAVLRMHNDLQMYHATLAQAANKAAAEGRFSRMSSSPDPQDELEQNDSTSEDALGTTDIFQAPTTAPRLAINTGGPSGLPVLNFDFDFQTDDMDTGFDDDYDADDDIIAAANADVLAQDNDGFYGQEFGFYASARPHSSDAESINGGFFGEDGDDGLTRNKSLKEPNLTPITERSEFSTRNSLISLGFGPASAGAHGPTTPFGGVRYPISPLPEHEITTFDDLRKLRASAFGGSNDGSIHSSEGKGTAPRTLSNHSPNLRPALTHSPALSTASIPQGSIGVAPAVRAHSSDGSTNSPPAPSSNSLAAQSPETAHARVGSPQVNAPTTFSFSQSDPDATPRKVNNPPESPATARKVPGAPPAGSSHSRQGSDSITYVREPGTPQQPPRWVLERRRTSEHGYAELVGREVVQGGWI